MLLIRRLIYSVCLILSLVFISFYGGNLSYMLFFMMVINSVIAVGYILYVYFTIKIYQEIPERRVTKQEVVSYRLMLHNESLIAYRDVKLQFMDELSQIAPGDIGCVGMEPGSGRKLSGELVCRYSGTYYVGVDSIEIMDYFKILRIRFQMPQKLKVTVKPRVLMPKQLSFLSEESHVSSLWGSQNDMPDNEVRKFKSGDNKNYIHWKNSAKRMELMVRSYATEENLQFIVMMDGCVEKSSFSEKIISCDKLRETLLAFVYYIYYAGYSVRVFLDDVYDEEIASKRAFDMLYQKITDYSFGKEQRMKQVAEKADATYAADIPFVLITSGHPVSGQEYSKKDNCCQSICGRKITVIDVDLYEAVEDVLRKNEKNGE